MQATKAMAMEACRVIRKFPSPLSSGALEEHVAAGSLARLGNAG